VQNQIVRKMHPFERHASALSDWVTFYSKLQAVAPTFAITVVVLKND
jgi:hypothetical protein